MEWSPQQDNALKVVGQWLESQKGVSKPGPRDGQIMRLFGYAGTGKTTLAKHLGDQCDGGVLFAAFTGKASLVLRSKGCRGASTIHSLIYSLAEETEGIPRFVLNDDSDLKDAELLIIDECSMVDEDLAKDLLSFGTPILVLGDPAQLPPVKGCGYFTEVEPDVMLKEVHRQARDNPIIRMSMDIREGRSLSLGTYGDSQVIRRSDVGRNMVMAADQVLVGKNATRHTHNRRIRSLKGYQGDMPLKGERLVCLRNNRSKGLFNGGLWTVADVVDDIGDSIEMELMPDDAGGRQQGASVEVRKEFFLGTEQDLPWHERRNSDEFNFGYALTVHKSQGSQWDNVMLFDESYAFRDARTRWLYTGVTRAAEKITVVQS